MLYWGVCGEGIGGRKGAQSSPLSPTLVAEGELGTGQETVGCGVEYAPLFLILSHYLLLQRCALTDPRQSRSPKKMSN